MTITDELLAELEELAFECNQHGGNWYEPRHMAAFPEYSCDQDFVVSASPATITALTAELRRLRAENAELEQSLAESRANDQAAMGWLTSLRWASGDRGERMLPELVTHIEGLAKDAKRYQWLRMQEWYDSGLCVLSSPKAVLTSRSGLGADCPSRARLDSAIDTAMATQ